MTAHETAAAVAKHVTGAESDSAYTAEGSLYFKGNGLKIEYRPQYQDWVTWYGGQLEGTLRGDDARFIETFRSHGLPEGLDVILRDSKFLNDKALSA